MKKVPRTETLEKSKINIINNIKKAYSVFQIPQKVGLIKTQPLTQPSTLNDYLPISAILQSWDWFRP